MSKFSNVVRYEVKPEYVDDFLKVCSDQPPMGGYFTDVELGFVQECHLWWSKHAGFLDLLIMVCRCLIAGETLQRGFPRRYNGIKIAV